MLVALIRALTCFYVVVGRCLFGIIGVLEDGSSLVVGSLVILLFCSSDCVYDTRGYCDLSQEKNVLVKCESGAAMDRALSRREVRNASCGILGIFNRINSRKRAIHRYFTHAQAEFTNYRPRSK